MKKRAIEIIKNLNMTIKKLHQVKNRVAKANNEVFKNPSASVGQLEQKRNNLITKYKLKKKEYAITDS